jgi:DNA-binding transcriptional MerR regulator
MESEKIERKYFSVREVAALLDVATSTLRFWEKEFKEIKPRTRKNGRRFYTTADVELLKKIHYLLKTEKLTLKGARLRLQLNTPPENDTYSLQQPELDTLVHLQAHENKNNLRQQLLKIRTRLLLLLKKIDDSITSDNITA